VYRFLISWRWVGFAVFVIVLAAVCTRLGFWQIHKHDHKLVQNDIIRAHFAQDPVPLTSVLPPGEKVVEGNEWTRVAVSGRYDVEHQVTVKFKTRERQPGVDVVTPLVLDSGDAVLVNRGWMQTSNNVERPDVPPPPAGTVQLTGWLRQDNGAEGQAIRPVDGQVRAISSVGLGETVPYDLARGYLNLRTESPEAAEPLQLEPEPDLGQGPHFFYALQWWFFSLLAVVGYVWFARAEAKERRNPTRIDGFASTSA
jgi:cytochrome oxidase assembly protein ShyY1